MGYLIYFDANKSQTELGLSTEMLRKAWLSNFQQLLDDGCNQAIYSLKINKKRSLLVNHFQALLEEMI